MVTVTAVWLIAVVAFVVGALSSWRVGNEKIRLLEDRVDALEASPWRVNESMRQFVQRVGVEAVLSFLAKEAEVWAGEFEGFEGVQADIRKLVVDIEAVREKIKRPVRKPEESGLA